MIFDHAAVNARMLTIGNVSKSPPARGDRRETSATSAMTTAGITIRSRNGNMSAPDVKSGNSGYAPQSCPERTSRHSNLFVIVSVVSFFFEVTGVRCSFNFGTHRSRVFLNNTKLFMFADKSG